MEFLVGADGDAEHGVTDGHTEEQSGEGAGEEEEKVPDLAPGFALLLAAEFHGYPAKDEREEEEHEGGVEAGEDGGIDFGEGGKHGAAEGDEPDFVAVPERPDGIHEEAAFLVVAHA